MTTNDEREALLAAIKASKSHESFLAEVTGDGNHPAIIATEVTPSGAGISWVDWSKVAEDYYAVLRGVDVAITAIGGDPESSKWDDWDITDLLRLGDAARHVREVYGATLTIELPKTQLKRGPKPLTPEQLMELCFDMQSKGWTQEVYSGRKHISRYAVQQAAKYCQENPSIFRQFQAKKLL